MNNDNKNKSWKDIGFNPDLQRSTDANTRLPGYIGGAKFEELLDETTLNRMIRPKNLSQQPQGDDPGKMYWDVTVPSLKIWINSTIGWFDVLNRPYGHMWIYNLGAGTTITVSQKDTFYQISTGVQTGEVYNFVFQNNRELKVLIPGVYLINWNLSIESASNNQEVEGAVLINGTQQIDSTSHVEVINAGKPASLGGNVATPLEAGSLISLGILNHTGATNIIIDHLNCTASLLTITAPFV